MPPGGYPAQQQGGYPGGQPGYGAPAQPGYGASAQDGYGPGYQGGFPPQPPPAPKKRGPWLWLVPVLVVVVAAAVVVPILLTRGGSSDAQGSGGTNAKSWQVTAQQMTAYTQGLGSRVDGNSFIVFADTAITAFARDTGKQQWSITPPGSGAAFCAMSRNVVHDQVAVAFGADNATGVHCMSTGLLDLNKHEFVWQKQVSQFVSTDVGSTDPSGQALVLAGDYLYVGEKTVLVRLSLADGTVQSLGPGFASGQDPCFVDDMAADSSTVYVAGRCLGSSTYESMLALDANSGSLRSSDAVGTGDVKLPAESAGSPGLFGAEFVSTSPLVMIVYGSASDNSTFGNFVGLDASLKPTWVSVQHDNTATAIDTEDDVPGTSIGGHQYNRAFVANGLLFAVTIFHDHDGKPTANKVVALDVETGQQKWATQVPGTSACDPVAVDGNTLLVAADQVWVGNMINPNTVFAQLDVRSGKVISTKPQHNPVVGAPNGVTLSGFDDMSSFAWSMADGRIYGFEQLKPAEPGLPVALSLG